MEEMKIYKELVAIKLKDGRIVTTDSNIEDVAKILNSTEFIVLGDIGFSKYEVKTFEKYIPTEIDNFIFSQKDKIIRVELEKIYKERCDKSLTTNGSTHLWQIYLDRKKE